MDSEMCIPTNRVPPEILQQLKAIGLLIQSESAPPTFTSSPSPYSSTSAFTRSLAVGLKKEGDECDDLEASDSWGHAVVHVLTQDREKEKKKDSDVVSLFELKKDSSSSGVVSVFHGTHEEEEVVRRGYEPRKDNDVISLFDHRLSSSGQNCSGGGGRGDSVKKESEGVGVLQSKSSPLKDVMNCSPRSSHSIPQSIPLFIPHYIPQAIPQSCALSPMQTGSPVSAQSLHHLHHQIPAISMSYPGHTDASEQHHVLPSPKPHPPRSPFKPQEPEDGERRVLNNRSPCKTPKRYEDSVRSIQSPFRHLSHNPSMSELSSSTLTPTTSSSLSSQSSCSRSPPSARQSCSSDDDLFREYAHMGCGTPSKDLAQKSPKVLTPPETPENDRKNVVPDVFTFDELACSQGYMTWEKPPKLQDQFTPTKRSPSTPRHPSSTPTTPRHPPSTPTTPSYTRRCLEVPASPTVPRGISPIDPRFLQRMEAASASSATTTTSSPQSRLKTSEMSVSPSPRPTTPHKLPTEDYAQLRRDCLSPRPKKRLSFDEDVGVSTTTSQLLQAQHQHQQRSRTFDASASPYSSHPSPRLSGSGVSENPFSFPAYLEGQHFGTPRGSGCSKSALSLAEFQKRMASLAAFQEEEEREGGGGPLLSGTRHVYESIEFQNRMALQSGRYTPKRKRSEPLDDGSDRMAVCTCAVMERDFLKMAECAYKRIRRIDTTPADFDRFRNELAQTNEILRESMGLMKHIRDICDHRKWPRW
ncbi:hypothetical protein ACOMHN_047993 [Nucella lapillus]